MDEQAATQPLSRRARRWVRATLAVVAILSIAVAAVVTQRTWIAERVMPILLTNMGIGPVTLTVDRLNLDGAAVTDLRIGDAQRIQKLDATYTLAGLRHGLIESVVVQGVALKGEWGPAGLSFNGLPLPEGSDGQQPAGLPIRSLHLNDINLTVGAPQGAFSITGTANIETPDGGVSDIDASFDTKSDLAGVVSVVHGRLLATRFANGETYGRAALRDGTAKSQQFGLEGLSGDVQFIVLQENAIDLDARLNAAELTVSGETLRDNKLTIGLRRNNDTNSSYLIEANLTNPDGRIDATGTVRQQVSGGTAASIAVVADIARDIIQAKMKGTATVSATADGQLAGDLLINDGYLVFEEHTFSGIEGVAEFSKEVGKAPQGEAAVAIRNIAGYSEPGQPTTLSVRLIDDRIEAQGHLIWQGGELSFDGQASQDTPLTFRAFGNVDGETSATLLPDGYAFRGDAAFAVHGMLLQPFETIPRLKEQPILLLDALEAQGHIESNIQSLRIPNFVDGGAIRGKVEVTSSAMGQRLSTKGLRFSVDEVPSSLLDSLPPPLREHLKGRLSGVIHPANNDDMATATLARKPNGYAVTVSTATEIKRDKTTLSLKGTVEAKLDDEGAVLSLKTPRTVGQLANLATPDGSMSGDLAVSNFVMMGGQARGDFQLGSTFKGSDAGAFGPLAASGKVRGKANLDADILTFQISPKSNVRVEPIKIPDRIKMSAPFTFTPTSSSHAQISIAKGLESLTFKTSGILPANRVSIKTGDGWIDAIVSQTTLTINGSGAEQKIRLSEGNLHLPAHKLRAAGLDLDVTIGDGIMAKVEIANLNHEAEKPIVIPLRLTASAAMQNEHIDFKARLFDTAERISLSLTGQHNLSLEQGNAALQARKITFLPTVLQPGQLFPILRDLTSEVDGELDALANLSWTKEELNSSMEVLINAKKLETDEVTLENGVSVIKFDSLFPPSTPPKQEINIGALDIGIPLLNGRAEFELNADGRILASLRELDFFGGRIETETFIIPPSFDDFSVPLLVTGAELEDLLELIQPKDLTATGTLNGRIPIVIANGEIAVRNGILESAEGGGSIQYRPEPEIRDSLAGANEGMSLLLKAVDDFKYESARVTLDEDAFGDVAFRFQIKGSNPELYKGIPVHLNVAMDGPLRKLLNQSVKTYTLPEKILSQIQNFKDTP